MIDAEQSTFWLLRPYTYTGIQGCEHIPHRPWTRQEILRNDIPQLLTPYEARCTFISYTPGIKCGSRRYLWRIGKMWDAVFMMEGVLKVVAVPVGEIKALGGDDSWLRRMEGAGVRCPSRILGAEWRAMTRAERHEIMKAYKRAIANEEALVYICVRQPWLVDLALKCIESAGSSGQSPLLSAEQVKFYAPKLPAKILKYCVTSHTTFLGRPRPRPNTISDQAVIGYLALPPIHRRELGLLDRRADLMLGPLTVHAVRELPAIGDRSTGLSGAEASEVQLADIKQTVEIEIEVLYDHYNRVRLQARCGDEELADALTAYAEDVQPEFRRRMLDHHQKIDILKDLLSAEGQRSPGITCVVQPIPNSLNSRVIEGMISDNSQTAELFGNVFDDLLMLTRQRDEIVNLIRPPHDARQARAQLPANGTPGVPSPALHSSSVSSFINPAQARHKLSTSKKDNQGRNTNLGVSRDEVDPLGGAGRFISAFRQAAIPRAPVVLGLSSLASVSAALATADTSPGIGPVSTSTSSIFASLPPAHAIVPSGPATKQCQLASTAPMAPLSLPVSATGSSRSGSSTVSQPILTSAEVDDGAEQQGLDTASGKTMNSTTGPAETTSSNKSSEATQSSEMSLQSTARYYSLMIEKALQYDKIRIKLDGLAVSDASPSPLPGFSAPVETESSTAQATSRDGPSTGRTSDNDAIIAPQLDGVKASDETASLQGINAALSSRLGSDTQLDPDDLPYSPHHNHPLRIESSSLNDHRRGSTEGGMSVTRASESEV